MQKIIIETIWTVVCGLAFLWCLSLIEKFFGFLSNATKRVVPQRNVDEFWVCSCGDIHGIEVETCGCGTKRDEIR